VSVVESTAKINVAIRECLDVCYHSSDPAHCITEYLARLRRGGEWTTGELTEVRSAAIYILRNIAAPEHDSVVYLGEN
jgi:hypothetical protein